MNNGEPLMQNSKDDEQPITRDTWPEFFRNEIDEDQTYMAGIIHDRRVVANFLDNLIRSGASDAEIVSRMMVFIKESHQLLNHFDETLYGPDAEKYGLVSPNRRPVQNPEQTPQTSKHIHR